MLLKTVQFIQRNFTYALIMALVLGLSTPGLFLPLFQSTLFILGVMMFLSSIRLSWKDIAGEFKTSPALFRESIVFMVIVPLVFYYSVLLVYPRYALAALLIVATPAAIATPALVGLYQGKVEKSILLVFSTTLLCPMTIPGLVYVLKGQSIELDYFGLLISLCIIVLFPLILAQLFKTWLPILTNKIEPYSGGISVICLSLVIATSFAIQADRIIENIQEAFYTTILAFALLSILMIVVDLLNRRYSAEEYTANVLSHTFKNLSLTVSLAANFFGSDELLLCSISMVPWVCLLPVFRYIQNKKTASSGFQHLNEIRKFRFNRAAADIHEKIEGLSHQLSALQSKVDNQQETIKKIETAQKAKALRVQESAGTQKPALRPATLDGKSKGPNPTEPVDRLYKKALLVYRSKNYGKAAKIFHSIIENYPGHNLTANALYWIGGCFYSQKNYKSAIRAFNRLLEKYPGGSNVPGSLLKIGYSYLALGDKDNTRSVLKKVVEEYPFTPAGSKAGEILKLEKIRSE